MKNQQRDHLYIPIVVDKRQVEAGQGGSLKLANVPMILKLNEPASQQGPANPVIYVSLASLMEEPGSRAHFMFQIQFEQNSPVQIPNDVPLYHDFRTVSNTNAAEPPRRQLLDINAIATHAAFQSPSFTFDASFKELVKMPGTLNYQMDRTKDFFQDGIAQAVNRADGTHDSKFFQGLRDKFFEPFYPIDRVTALGRYNLARGLLSPRNQDFPVSDYIHESVFSSIPLCINALLGQPAFSSTANYLLQQARATAGNRHFNMTKPYSVLMAQIPRAGVTPELYSTPILELFDDRPVFLHLQPNLSKVTLDKSLATCLQTVKKANIVLAAKAQARSVLLLGRRFNLFDPDGG